jgi:hypothetical protein
MKGLIMALISNPYNNFKCLKITNEYDPTAFQMGKNRSDFEARKATENLKCVTQILIGGGGGRWRKMPGFGSGKSWQP